MNFPEDFFFSGLQDRGISPEYRKLELLTEVELTPECRARVDTEGEVLGIYESFQGVREAILRNQVDMALFFLARLNPLARERLIYELSSGRLRPAKYQTSALRAVLQQLNLVTSSVRVSPLEVEIEEIAQGRKPFSTKDFAYRKTLNELYYLVSFGKEEALEQAFAIFSKTTKANRSSDASSLFSASLKSGRVDFVNRVVERLYTYPKVEELVSQIPFIDVNFRSMDDYILRKEKHDIEWRYYSDALEGGNPRLFVYIFALSSREALYDAYTLVEGYSVRRNLLDRYICAQFFPLRDYALPVGSSIDLYHILSQKLPEGERRDHATKFVSANLGNIDILFYILDTYPEEKDYLLQLIKDKYQGLYPLTERILAQDDL